MRKFLCVVILSGCATAGQQAADSAALHEEAQRAPELSFPFGKLQSVPSFDAIGGRYRLVSAQDGKLCFEAMFRSNNGNETGIAYSLIAVNKDGTEHRAPQKSSTLLGVKQGLISTDNDTQNRGGMPVNAGAQELGHDASNDAATESQFSQAGSSRHAGTPPPVIATQNTQTVDPVVGNGNENRIVTHAYMEVCFADTALGADAAFMAIQRGDVSLVNPHPPRAIWKLARLP